MIRIKQTWQARTNQYVTPFLLVLVDFIVCNAAAILSAALVERVVGAPLLISKVWYSIMPCVFILYMIPMRMYRTRRILRECTGRIFRATFYTIVTVIVLDYIISGERITIPRGFLFTYWAISYAFACFGRIAARNILRKIGIWQNTIIIIGAGKTAERFVQAFSENYEIVGIIEDDRSKPLLQRYPHLGGFADIRGILHQHPVQEVVLATPGLSKKEQATLFYLVQPYVRSVSVIPNIFGVPIGNVEIESSLDDRLLVLKTRNNLNSLSNQLLKRAFDLLLGSILAVLISPVLIVLAVLIKLDSNGPAFYNAARIGKGGKTFKCYKFRSMYVNADHILLEFLGKHPEAEEEWKEFQKLRGDDPRVTHIGKFIRKYSLDELPQIFNVLKGEMSLVGPRPYLLREKEKIGRYLPVICMTTPGITGLWQVSGRSNISFHGRLHLDAWYVRNWSLWQDIVLLFRTIGVVCGKKGAY
ncbi:MAG: undecaprenyl-phosphate galactose phosphotransferase WbaP [Selenomonadaceae bacterium]|nr:undecaprenyl-phosphate galactose phosphotransferase WbaP [Selenomonadaceae bacterium]